VGERVSAANLREGKNHDKEKKGGNEKEKESGKIRRNGIIGVK
jgi:hypothetical protein